MLQVSSTRQSCPCVIDLIDFCTENMALDKNEARLGYCAESHVRRMDSTSTPLRKPSVPHLWKSAAAWKEIQHGSRSSVKHFNIRRFCLHSNVGLWNWTNTIQWHILKTSGLMFKNKSRRWITTPQASHYTLFSLSCFMDSRVACHRQRKWNKN